MRPDPEKVRAWMNKHRGKGFKTHPPVPRAARQEVTKRQGDRCLIPECHYRGRLEMHHVLPKDDWPDLVQLPDNLVGLCRQCHQRHEMAYRRILRPELPRVALALAEREGPRALAYVERIYPPGGSDWSTVPRAR